MSDILYGDTFRSAAPKANMIDEPRLDGAGALYAMERSIGTWEFGWLGSNLTLTVLDFNDAQSRHLWVTHRNVSRKEDLVLNKDKLRDQYHVTWEQVPAEYQPTVQKLVADKPWPIQHSTNDTPLNPY